MQPIAIITVLFFVAPFLVIILKNLIPKKVAKKTCLYMAGAVAIIQIAASIADFFLISASKIHAYDFSLLWNLKSEGSERFSINSLSLVILFCIGMVVLVSVLIAYRTIERKRTVFVNLLMTLILGMNGMLVVTDLFSLYVFMEIVGLSSFVLIAMFKTETGLEGSFKYLVMSVLAGIFILTGLSFVFMQTGSLLYQDINSGILNSLNGSQSVLTYAAFILLLAGFSIKTGAVPFHSWLPDAHQSANTAVSILLSGIVIKVAGVYGLIVVTRLFRGIPAISVRS
jgi:formate hydrogenlyase subunit 3/multisubunit Na+/H+ antiporter MnhD subunit